MPKILKEADNFSSFTWKDFSKETLAFIHQEYLSNEMTLDEYIEAYYGNKISGIKHEADRLFEEGKKKALERGDFPEELLEVWTKKIIPKDSDEKDSTTKVSVRVNSRNKDKNANKREDLRQSIMSNEADLDELRDLDRRFEESNAQFLAESSRYFEELEETFHQRGSNTSNQLIIQKSIVEDTYNQIRSVTSLQEETFQESSRVARISMENKIEALHQERNALAW